MKTPRQVTGSIDNDTYMRLCSIRDRLNLENIQKGGKPIKMVNVVREAIKYYTIMKTHRRSWFEELDEIYRRS